MKLWPYKTIKFPLLPFAFRIRLSVKYCVRLCVCVCAMCRRILSITNTIIKYRLIRNKNGEVRVRCESERQRQGEQCVLVCSMLVKFQLFNFKKVKRKLSNNSKSKNRKIKSIMKNKKRRTEKLEHIYDIYPTTAHIFITCPPPAPSPRPAYHARSR